MQWERVIDKSRRLDEPRPSIASREEEREGQGMPDTACTNPAGSMTVLAEKEPRANGKFAQGAPGVDLTFALGFPSARAVMDQL